MVLYRKRRRITDMMSALFSFYDGLDDDMVQSIIVAVSTEHNGSLITLSDIIDMIEGDIASGNSYEVEVSADKDAVLITTMHKSKGMEFETVILPFIDLGTIPNKRINSPTYHYHYPHGIRCANEVVRTRSTVKICKSWKSAIVRKSISHDYDEDRRLMFVAMSRAKQYMTLICGNKPSKIIKFLSEEKYELIMDAPGGYGSKPSDSPIQRPAIAPYSSRRTKVGVHDLMDARYEGSRTHGMGKEYGIEVHEDAQLMFMGVKPKKEKPEHAAIRDVLDGTKDADLRYVEIDCTLPLNDIGVTVKGTIDLFALYPDHIEIHDYKTDSERTDKVEKEYMFQLSVYAHAASGYYGDMPVRCFIDYVSIGETCEFDPMELSAIVARVKKSRGID